MAENNESNETLDQVETIKIGEHEVSMKTSEKGETTIETPEGLEDDPIFQKEAQRVISGMATVNKKGMETNQKMRELERKEAELQKLESELKEQRKVEKKTLKDEIMAELGVKEAEDLDEVSRADYLDAQERVLDKRSQKENRTKQESQILETFAARGGDTEDLKIFAKSLNAPISQALVNQYTKTIQRSPKFSSENLSKMQGKTINFVKKGAITAQGRKTPAQRILEVSKTGNRW